MPLKTIKGTKHNITKLSLQEPINANINEPIAIKILVTASIKLSPRPASIFSI